MGLQNELETQGQWLFRWRSIVPLAFLPAVAIALATMSWPFGSLVFHEFWEYSCLAVSFAGLALRIVVAGYVPANTSGRNTKGQLAQSLNTTGAYAVVRHPLYLGNFLIALGAIAVPFNWWLIVSFTLVFWLYYERIMFAEETFLRARFGAEFDAWARQTPAFVPRTARWLKPARPFSWRNALKREYTGLLVVVGLHAGIEVVEHWFIEHRILYEPGWEILLGGSMATYVVLRAMKKYTTWLNDPGRN